MFIGHFAVGFAAKRAAPRASLGWLMAAPMALDLLWPIFLIAGIERVRIVTGNTPFTRLAFDSYPWSHSLLMTVVWSVLFGMGYWAATRYVPGAVVIGAGVLSHWFLDVVTHHPDMPLAPGVATKVGLSLWDSTLGTMITEGVLFAAAVWLYGSFTTARDRTGRLAFVGFVLFALAGYAASIYGAAPPSVTVMAYGSLVGYLVPLWAGWFEAHRTVRTPS